MVILKAAHGLPRITVLTVDHPNKREQLATAIPEVRSRIIILADDDVRWPTTLLPWILAPFERADVGAVGTCQSLIRPPNASWSEQVWAFLGAIYLERRNFDCGATNYIDGAVPCISGRTAAYRSQILKDESFLSCFGTETFMGRDIKHADDDNFKTRWVEDKGWKIRIQIHPEAEVKTYLERGWQYLYQCLRWSRSNWRSNLKTLGILNMWKCVLTDMLHTKRANSLDAGSTRIASMPFFSPHFRPRPSSEICYWYIYCAESHRDRHGPFGC